MVLQNEESVNGLEIDEHVKCVANSYIYSCLPAAFLTNGVFIVTHGGI